MEEEWRDLEGFEGLYQVSNYGRVKSFVRHLGGKPFNYLKPKPDKDGYLQVSLAKNKKPHTKKIHRLVAQAFIPNPNNYPQVNHKDERKDNNNVDNLEWCTNSYNQRYGTCSERKKLHTDYEKIKASNFKPVLQMKDGIVIAEYPSATEATKKYRPNAINCANISGVCNGRHKIAYGYEWKYKEDM